MTPDLTAILDHTPAWLMVLFRLTGIFILAPVFGSTSVPRHVKLFLAVGLSMLVYPVLLSPGRPSAAMIGQVVADGLFLWELIARIAMELLIGFTIGYAASLPLIGIQMGGMMMDQQLGIAFAGIINPDLDEESGIIGQTLFLAALAIFVILGGHQQLLLALLNSFDQIPLGGFTGMGSVLDLLLGLLATAFELALRVAAPVMCVMFLLMTAMGFVARTVPQMNILSVGFIVRILVGCAFLVLVISVTLTMFTGELGRMMSQIFGFFSQG